MRRTPLALVLALWIAGCSDDDGFAEDGFAADDDGNEYNDHCDAQADWDPAWAEYEAEVVILVNARRGEGATCGDQSFGSAGPIVAEAQLRCAARLHSQDMFERAFFDHTNPDGMSPWDRVALTDYTGSATGENIAGGYPDPEAVMQGWMDSPGHCANIMNPDHDHIGVGYYGDASLWTQVMGSE